MFRGKRYITKNAEDVLPLSLQIQMFDLIEAARNQIKLDYLQTFKCSIISGSGNISLQKIVHSQEVPPYKNTINIKCERIINAKVFVIDSGDYCTLMLAEEY
ncbi:TPA: DUF960 family protein [Bacillus cereus]